MEWSIAVHQWGDGLNPFYENFPVVIDHVVPMSASNQWWLKDQTGAGVAIAAHFSFPWKLLALSGGAPVKLFAIGKETEFIPLGVWVDGHYKMLAWMEGQVFNER